MNNFDFIMGFNGITSPVGRIIPDRKFISYFPLQNAKITSKTSVQGNKKSLNMSLLDRTNDAF